MAIFTAEELDRQIATYKSALLAVARGQVVEVDGERLTRADMEQIKETLTWLDSERQKLDTSSAAPAGRTFAKQGGTGRW